MKKQTPVEWLYDQIGDTAPYEYAAQIASYLEEAMKMENEIYELSNKISVKCEGNVDLPNMTNYPFIPELSDEEIKEWIDSTPYYGHCTTEYKEGLEDGINWYREQLKNKK